MGVDHNSFVDSKGVAENHIGGLASNAAKFNQLLHGARHLAAMPFDKSAATSLNVLRFAAKKSKPPDVFFKSARRSVSVIGGRAVCFEQISRNEVDLFI